MIEWRDARLQRALADAPDAQLRPGSRTRQAVLDAAREAVMPVPVAPAPWWKKLWQTSGDRRAPWNAAFATLVLATLVTVLWYEREVPGARTTSGDVEPSRSAPAPTPAPAPKPAPQATPVPETVQPPAMAETSRPAAASRPAVEARSADASRPAVAPAPPARPQTGPIAPQASSELRSEATTDALRDQNLPALSKSAPRTADTGKAAETAGASAPSAAAPITAPAAPAAAPAAPAAAAPLAGARSDLAARRAPVMVNDWTHLRLSDQARSAEVTRDQAARLADLVSAMARNAQGTEPLEGAVTLRVEFRRAGELTGLLELADAQVRWTRGLGAQGESFTARPSTRELQALREEIERLMQR